MSRILVAEDEERLRMSITLSLRIEGYEVTETADGSEALEAIIRMKSAQTPFDLLVCDVQMPRMTGEELLVKLKNARTMLPTLVITGFGEKELLVRLMRAGCRDFADKPFEMDLLCKRVAAMLSDASSSMSDERRREQLAAIGERTIRTAHDLSTILGGTIGYADAALEHLEPHHPLRHTMEKILTRSNRAAEICRHLLTSHRVNNDTALLSTEINSLVARVGTLLQDIAPENITVSAKTPDHPVWLTANAEGVQQALLTLGFNAFAAMADGGALTLQLRLAKVMRPGGENREASCVVLSVGDTGSCLPAEMRALPFTEEYTSGNDGFGFGLNIVKQIVEQEHDGWIGVASEKEQGTVFSLHFPVGETTRQDDLLPGQ